MKGIEYDMSDAIAISTTQLTKSFGNIEAVSNVNLKISNGEIYALLGKNGAGKTTLFKLLLGLQQPTCGSCCVLGKDTKNSILSILKEVGTLIEIPVFFENLSAMENLAIHLEYMGTRGNIQETLEMVGLSVTGDSPVSHFSLGMRQRLAIARAIIHKPKVLILDEPVNGLDPTGIKEMRDLFLYLAHHEKMTILISSHILSEIEKIADRVGFLVNGKLVEETTLKNIKEKSATGLEDYFLKITEGKN